MKRIAKKVLVVSCVIIMVFIMYEILVQKNSRNIQNEIVQNEEKVKTDAELTKEIVEKNLEKVTRIKEMIDTEPEIVVLKEKGHIILEHDKVKEKNKFIDWLVFSGIEIKVKYIASFSVSSNDIDICLDEGSQNIKVILDTQKIKLHAINIDDIILYSKKGLIAKGYSPSEVVALTMIAKEMVEEQISNDNGLMFLAEMNLKSYLQNLAYSMGIFNIEIVEK